MTLLRPLRLLLRAMTVLALVALAGMGVAWVVGTAWIRAAEPEPLRLPDGVPGTLTTVDERAVHVIDTGQGAAAPLLLVHGFAGSTMDWEEHVLAPLAAARRVIAVDLLGMGFSARDEGLAYGPDLWTQQLVGVLDVLRIPRAAVAGHALGGALAARLATTHPERVERLVLVSTLVPIPESEQSWWQRGLAIPGVGELLLGRTAYLPEGPGFAPGYTARAAAIFRIAGTRPALLGFVRGDDHPERIAEAYARIAVPTLAIHGTDDDVFPWEAAHHYLPRIHDALVLPLDGVGHWPLRDAPERVLAAIDGFFDPHASPP
ncbi:MAG: alpha/beta hydrolase [bacterium]|nr:alpha/beta hydrolase [bacterium]